jgi:peptidase M23-like protein
MAYRLTTARGVLTILIAALALGPAAASPGARGSVPNPIVFPVVGPYRYTNDFGDPRGQGRHEGNDVLAPRKAIVVATEDGRIKFWTTSARAGCMLYLYGVSGTTYLYIHLNNDVTTGNDNRGKCVPGGSYWPGLKDGAKVVAGQAIGYVGDSGDADGTPHLHFEIHPGDGGPVNPYVHLNRATRVLFTAPLGAAVTLSLKGTVVAAKADRLSVKVETVTVFPISLTLLGLRKPIVLTLPSTALVDKGVGAPTSMAEALTGSLVRRPVIVLTEPLRTSLDAQTAKDGVFAVARIVLRAA